MRGATVAWGRSHEAAGAPAYWPWVQVARAAGQAVGPERLGAELGGSTAELVHILPELRERPSFVRARRHPGPAVGAVPAVRRVRELPACARLGGAADGHARRSALGGQAHAAAAPAPRARASLDARARRWDIPGHGAGEDASLSATVPGGPTAFPRRRSASTTPSMRARSGHSVTRVWSRSTNSRRPISSDRECLRVPTSLGSPVPR